MAYNNLSDLFNAIQDQVNKSLKESVAPSVVEKLQEHVESDVYQAYKPLSYERTGALKNDMQVEIIDNGIIVTDERYDEMDGSKYVVPIIESGQGYTWNTPIAGTERPFIENTKTELEATGLHVEVLKQSLKAKGIDVK